MSPWHWLIVIGVFALLFGAKRLPDAARAIGRSTRILKSELSELRGEDAPTPAETSPAAPTVASTVTPPPAPAPAPTVDAEKVAPQAAGS